MVSIADKKVGYKSSTTVAPTLIQDFGNTIVDVGSQLGTYSELDI